MAIYYCKKNGVYYGKRLWKKAETIEADARPNKHFESEAERNSRLRIAPFPVDDGGGDAPKTMKELSDLNEKLEADTRPPGADEAFSGEEFPPSEEASETEDPEDEIFNQ
jgi:hypothetical protein